MLARGDALNDEEDDRDSNAVMLAEAGTSRKTVAEEVSDNFEVDELREGVSDAWRCVEPETVTVRDTEFVGWALADALPASDGDCDALLVCVMDAVTVLDRDNDAEMKDDNNRGDRVVERLVV